MQWLTTSAGPLFTALSVALVAFFGWKALRREAQKSKAEEKAERQAELERLQAGLRKECADKLAAREREHAAETAGMLRDLAAMERDRDYYRGRSDALGTPRRESSP